MIKDRSPELSPWINPQPSEPAPDRWPGGEAVKEQPRPATRDVRNQTQEKLHLLADFRSLFHNRHRGNQRSKGRIHGFGCREHFGDIGIQENDDSVVGDFPGERIPSSL